MFIKGFVFIAFLPAAALCAQDCPVPPDALAGLRGYLSYESSMGAGRAGARVFSFAPFGEQGAFLQHDVPRGHDPATRLVYLFRPGHPLTATGCRADAQWTKCAEMALREAPDEPATVPGRTIGPSCDLSVMVPEWRPTPDDDRLKKATAAGLLQELISFGYRSPKSVTIRDFNLGDPEISFYVVDAEGHDTVQGCTFYSARRPYCAWHLYGQSPIEKLKREIMARPYKLYP
jgi:hypothetical protein